MKLQNLKKVRYYDLFGASLVVRFPFRSNEMWENLILE